MNILHRVLVVEFSRLSEPLDEKGTPLLLSWQSLRFRLTIAFSNVNGELDREGAALMAAMGESDFHLMWRKLFHTVRIVPVILGSAASSSAGKTQNLPEPESRATTASGLQHGVGCFFSFGVPQFWENRAPAEKNAQFLASSVMATAGKILTVAAEQCDEAVVAPAEVLKAEMPKPYLKGAVPSHLHCTYTFSYALPELEDFHGPLTLGFVLLLSFPNGSGKGGTDREGDDDFNDDVLLRALVPVEDQRMAWYRPSYVVLGTCYYRAHVSKLLCCSSEARRVSRYRVLVNVNVVNIAGISVRVQQVFFDIFSTWIGNSLGSLSSVPLWSEQRAGPRSGDLKYIELLRRVVTVTPVVVHEFCAPVMLEPEESMNFQFAIQLLPHLCYLFEPNSLESVYGKFLRGYMEDVAEEEIKTVLSSPSGPMHISSQRITTSSTSVGSLKPVAVATGATDEISCEELLQLMSFTFTSHVYVYYEAISPTSKACSEEANRSINGDGIYASLQLRHPVHWSMGLP
ncbi:hypothetical protein C3747_21g72 [Trypanosoma cruzi]|uniref:Uncharacterized protein n=2 Tax=Trypanosoma cruzi TaxID=5693 RepID=Q4D3V6_TRYCC|nr:hypothetical protein, conserved [Trypanosoma cruzi]EAN87205.1 hypothetical protein, conserved [Trypanosoma cruzi]PWV16799.1 hypothetical protein C3747_21g72 [Trypanosoma cruzi]RNC46657.1 Protein X92 [Trypanosoma cruzi]|eukprot:XP_809056.1 hypothetical protein [Trypanosoma cruzi strain CL Brener]